jgi:hypothetical protein
MEDAVKREQIIEMAKDAGLPPPEKCCQEFTDQLERFASLVAAAEREACAKVCEDTDQDYNADGSPRYLNYQCAAAIRARGQQ